MALRIPWDKYEAAVLLDYCIKVEEGELSRETAISIVSKKLRNRAVNKGIAIDNVFRNENGISMQLSSMKNCYYGKEEGLSISKLFREVVALYKEDQNAFLQILNEETNSMDTSVWQEFLLWLQNEDPKNEQKITSELKMLNAMGLKKGILKQKINEIENADEIKEIRMQTAKGEYFTSKKTSLKVCHALKVYEHFLSIYNLNKTSNKEKVNTSENLEVDEYKVNFNDNKGYVNEEIPTEHPQTFNYSENLFKLIATHFKYGFRVESILDLMHLRNFAEEEGVHLPEDDQELKSEIKSIGVLVENKVFAWEEELVIDAGSMLNDIFQSGVGIVFLQTFYDKNSEWMEKHYISSIMLLKEVLKQSHPEYYYGQNIITPRSKKNETTAIIEEIHRVNGSSNVILVNEVAEKLSYIPYEKILWTLSYSPDFIRISEGKYYCMDSFVIEEEDASAILDYVIEECNSKGYASITDIPMGNIPEDNYEISGTALQMAVFNAILSDHYNVSNKIITAHNTDD